jgi:hypothetical protein
VFLGDVAEKIAGVRSGVRLDSGKVRSHAELFLYRSTGGGGQRQYAGKFGQRRRIIVGYEVRATTREMRA